MLRVICYKKFVQFKNREKDPHRGVTLACNVTKSNAPHIRHPRALLLHYLSETSTAVKFLTKREKTNTFSHFTVNFTFPVLIFVKFL